MRKRQKTLILCFVLLLIFSAALMISSQFLSPGVRKEVLPISADAFKTVMGALVGALSVMLGKETRDE